MHSADRVIGADIFLMSAICAHRAPKQVLPYLCLCVPLFVKLSDILLSRLWCPAGYPGGYPATAPTYTPNLYQTGSPGYPPGEHQFTHTHTHTHTLFEDFVNIEQANILGGNAVRLLRFFWELISGMFVTF